MYGRPWSVEDLQVLRERYPDEPTKKIAAALNRPIHSVYNAAWNLGLRKSRAFYESPECGILRKGETRPESVVNQFKPGQKPWNDGKRMPGWGPGRMKETQFKKGGRSGRAAKLWHPIGSVLADSDGYLRIKVREAVHGAEASGYGNRDVWPFLQRCIWELHHGPIPEGHVVVFKNGNRSDVSIGNLECISRGELADRNRMWGRLPRELAEAIQMNGALKRQIRRLTNAKQDVRPEKPSLRNAGSVKG